MLSLYVFSANAQNKLSSDSTLLANEVKKKNKLNFKASISRTSSHLNYDIYIADNWVKDPNIVNRFEYYEQIHAAYIRLSKNLDKFTLQADLYGDYTRTTGRLTTTGEINKTNYFNIFPTFIVSYQTAQQHTIGLLYKRMISRPGFSQVNPFENILAAYSFISTHPYLIPAYTHNFQLLYTYRLPFISRLGYSATSDLITLTPIDDNKNQHYRMIRKNFMKNHNISTMINYRIAIFKIWMVSLTVQGAYQINISDETSDKLVHRGTSLTVQLNHKINITPTFSAGITGLYFSGINQGNFVIHPIGNFSAGLQKWLFNDLLVLSLTLNDILQTSKEKGYVRHENIHYYLISERINRRFNLTARVRLFSSSRNDGSKSKKKAMEN